MPGTSGIRAENLIVSHDWLIRPHMVNLAIPLYTEYQENPINEPHCARQQNWHGSCI